MSAETCARYILHAIEKKKRMLVLTFTSKFTVWINKFFPSLADRLIHRYISRTESLSNRQQHKK